VPDRHAEFAERWFPGTPKSGVPDFGNL